MVRNNIPSPELEEILEDEYLIEEEDSEDFIDDEEDYYIDDEELIYKDLLGF